VAILIGLAVATIALLLALGGGREAVTALVNVEPGWIVLALLVHYSGFVVRGLRWQQLLRALGHPLPWRYTMALLLSGWFVSALLPARAGDLLRVGVLRLTTTEHAPVPVADGFGSILLERVLDLVALLLLGAGVGFALLRTQLPGWILVAYGVGVAALTAGGVALFLAPSLLIWLQKRWQQPLWQRLLGFATEVIQSLRSVSQQPGMMLTVLLASLYIWFCDALLMWLVLKALGVTAGLGSITFVALTVDIFAAIPVTPGGIGQVEAVNVALLALLPLPPFNIAAAVLANRAISYWSFLLFSGFVTFAAGIGQLMMRSEDRAHGQSAN
jgi:uncharacterized protein (TIRG00374 family)